jgi:hypothetical protein
VTNSNWDAFFGAAPMQNADVAQCMGSTSGERGISAYGPSPTRVPRQGFSDGSQIAERETPFLGDSQIISDVAQLHRHLETDHKSLYHILDQ